MKPRKVSTDSDRQDLRLQRLNDYLERNFPDFFAEARFQVGDDDYFLYARFGQYLARTIEQNRASGRTINRGFTLLNQMARASARHPRIREMLISGRWSTSWMRPRRGLSPRSAYRPRPGVVWRACGSR